MKRALCVALLLIPGIAWAKPKPAEYTINVHVQASEIAWNGIYVEQLRVVIDGKKYLLNRAAYTLGLDLKTGPLVPGDYKAKLVTEGLDPDNPVPSYEYHQKYEFLFPDGKTRKYVVFGASE